MSTFKEKFCQYSINDIFWKFWLCLQSHGSKNQTGLASQVWGTTPKIKQNFHITRWTYLLNDVKIAFSEILLTSKMTMSDKAISKPSNAVGKKAKKQNILLMCYNITNKYDVWLDGTIYIINRKRYQLLDLQPELMKLSFTAGHNY